MIIVCPACGRRYRVERSRLSIGVRLRCSGCRQVFDARRPTRAAEQRLDPGASAPAAPPSRSSTPEPGSASLVLIGDENRPFRSTAQKMLQALGCRVETYERGEAVFRAAVQLKPALLLLNIRLPGLSGASVCEGVKGSPHLKAIKVVLVRSIINPPAVDELVRPGFEPDDQIEDTIDETDLQNRLAHQLEIDPPRKSGRVDRPVGLETPPADAAPPGTQDPPRPAVRELDPRDALDPAAEIERLARIMLSDLKLYNPARFASAMKDGRLLETFRNELLRGRDLVTTRFPDLPNRVALLTDALRRGIEAEQSTATAGL